MSNFSNEVLRWSETYSNQRIVFNGLRIIDVVFTAAPYAFGKVFAALLSSTGSCETKLIAGEDDFEHDEQVKGSIDLPHSPLLDKFCLTSLATWLCSVGQYRASLPLQPVPIFLRELDRCRSSSFQCFPSLEGTVRL